MTFESPILRRLLSQWLRYCLLLAALVITSSLVDAAPPPYKLTTLTFHVIAFAEGGTVLGGTLEGPDDSKVREVELVVQFFKSGHLLETRTFSTRSLNWPKASFQFPVPTGVDCYDVIALRAFDQNNKLMTSFDATTKLLSPGRCKVSIN